MNLSVKPDGVVRVSCNRRRSQREIVEFVKACRNFIEKRRGQIAEVERLHPPRKFLSGEKFLWLGEHFALDVVWSWQRRPQVQLTGGDVASGFEMLAPLSSTVSERARALMQFYRSQAEIHLEGRVDYWSCLTGLQPTSVTIRGQRTLWGSCTVRGALSLNWKLMCAPFPVIDYVVLHELAHLREPNHSPRFWALVAQFMPEHQLHRQWLKEHQQEISRQF